MSFIGDQACHGAGLDTVVPNAIDRELMHDTAVELREDIHRQRQRLNQVGAEQYGGLHGAPVFQVQRTQ